MLSDGSETLVKAVIVLGDHDAYPLAIHCGAGRDRTGIIVACVLDLLDVEDNAIASDYALSDRAVDDGGRAPAQLSRLFRDFPARYRNLITRVLLGENTPPWLTEDATPAIAPTVRLP